MPTSRQPANIPTQRCGAVGSPVGYDGEEVTNADTSPLRSAYRRQRNTGICIEVDRSGCARRNARIGYSTIVRSVSSVSSVVKPSASVVIQPRKPTYIARNMYPSSVVSSKSVAAKTTTTRVV